MLESYGTFVVRHQQVNNFGQTSEAETPQTLDCSPTDHFMTLPKKIQILLIYLVFSCIYICTILTDFDLLRLKCGLFYQCYNTVEFM